MNVAKSVSQPLFFILLTVPAFAGSPLEGIKNFHQVDVDVYRGAQPDSKGFVGLAQLGVKTVIDLREPGRRSDAEQAMVTGAGMKYINVPMTGLTPPSQAEIARLLGILEDSNQGPVFVHCMRGADRTGAVIAAYRIHHDGWENARALKEAESMGMSSFQFPRKGFIREFQVASVPVNVPALASQPAAVAPSSVTTR